MDVNNVLTKETGLAFLRAHQPMPNTDYINCEDLVTEWHNVCKYFTEHPCIESVPLFLGAFGGGHGYGIYQSFQDLLAAHNPEEIIPFIIDALNSPSIEVRLAAAEYGSALETSNKRYIDALLSKIEDTEENEEIRKYCSGGLWILVSNNLINIDEYYDRINYLIKNEKDIDVIDDLEDMMNMKK